MSKLRVFLKRHRLWVAFFAAFVPLLVLLAMQYGWLVKLEHASALAHKASLYNFLEAVATEVKYFYGANAERTLNVSPSIFTQGRCEQAAWYFKKKSVAGARRLFVVNLEGERMGELFFFDPVTFAETDASPPEIRAISMAVAPWKLMSLKHERVESTSLLVDERDTSNRMILQPITDIRSKVVGVAGMIVDTDYFKRVALPGAIERVLACSTLAEEEAAENLIVTLRDRGGALMFATGKVRAGADEVTRPLPFVFGDWRLGLRSRYVTPEQWARGNFAMNMTLAVLIAGVLLAGIVLALRTASREMKLSEMKSDFVSNVSHELRTPLSSIRVFAEFLRLGRAQGPEKVREYGAYIENESRRLTQLIDNILDFARIDSGRKTYHLERADLGQVVSEVLRTFQVRTTHSGFQIRFQQPDGPLPPVRMDAGSVAQAFHNLLDNAVKYSGDARTIDVSLRRDQGSAVISVRDHGIGISRDEQQKIFERFHRVGTGLVHDVKGSGLGLSIVTHIVEAHRGDVTVDSEPGRGSTFSIHLPLDPEGSVTVPRSVPVQVSPVGVEGPRVP